MFNLSYQPFANAYRRFERMDKDSLLAELGWPDGQRACTSALITSLALLAAGAPLNGNARIEAGALTGRRAFTGANHLADWLVAHFGAPQGIPLDGGPGEVAYQLYGQRGIVAFMQGSGPQGGLIGLLDGANAAPLCCAAEIHHPLEVRFWALN
ncbi:MAG: hypothetical protein H6R13_2201 [Proteobacteria bacterium]|nr:hypothetical protein [Pseudomonadota bacterium]